MEFSSNPWNFNEKGSQIGDRINARALAVIHRKNYHRASDSSDLSLTRPGGLVPGTGGKRLPAFLAQTEDLNASKYVACFARC